MIFLFLLALIAQPPEPHLEGGNFAERLGKEYEKAERGYREAADRIERGWSDRSIGFGEGLGGRISRAEIRLKEIDVLKNDFRFNLGVQDNLTSDASRMLDFVLETLESDAGVYCDLPRIEVAHVIVKSSSGQDRSFDIGPSGFLTFNFGGWSWGGREQERDEKALEIIRSARESRMEFDDDYDGSLPGALGSRDVREAQRNMIEGAWCLAKETPGKIKAQVTTIFNAASTGAGAAFGNAEDQQKVRAAIQHLEAARVGVTEMIVTLAGAPPGACPEMAEKWNQERAALIDHIYEELKGAVERYGRLSPEEQQKAIGKMVASMAMDAVTDKFVGKLFSFLTKVRVQKLAVTAVDKAEDAYSGGVNLTKHFRVLRVELAEDMNRQVVSRSINHRAPWKAGTKVKVIVSDRPTKLYTIRTSSPSGISSWATHKNPLEVPANMSREAYWQQLRSELSIPPNNRMTEVISVEIPAGHPIYVGIAGPAVDQLNSLDTWGAGGGIQYQISGFDRIKAALEKTRESLWQER